MYLEELIDLDLTSKEVFNSMGVVFKGLEDDINAKKMFMKSLDLDNNFILAKKNLESL